MAIRCSRSTTTRGTTGSPKSGPIDKPMSAADYFRGKFAAIGRSATLDTGHQRSLRATVRYQVARIRTTGWRVLAPVRVSRRRGSRSACHSLRQVGWCSSLCWVHCCPTSSPGTSAAAAHGDSRCTRIHSFFSQSAVALVGAARGDTGRLLRNPALFGVRDRQANCLRVAAVATAALLGTPGIWACRGTSSDEAIAHGESTSVETGERDRVFYRSGWSAPHFESITVRVSRALGPSSACPCPSGVPTTLVLRLDPVTPTSPENVDVLFNRHLVGRLRLTWNPDRVGSYRLRMREDIVNAGSNELIIIPASVIPAGSAGPRFAWLDPPSVRLWSCGCCRRGKV